MRVLGIETSCDETSAAVVKDGCDILSCVTSSSMDFHKNYGGIVPEIASRKQLETIAYVAESALKKAKTNLKDIKLIGVTDRPGLLGSLLVGMSFAKAISFGLNVPLLDVDHLKSHIYAGFLNAKKIKLPFIALIVSGGHTSLFYVRDFNKIEPLGSTNDDACGEAFDKVAKILGMAYPGGPLIEKLAKKGDPAKIRFNCSDTKNPLDFSFSGIKTAVLYYVQRHVSSARCQVPKRTTLKADISASFQETVIDTLIKKSLLACRAKKNNRLVIGGGVAANNRLRERFLDEARQQGIEIFFPAKELCMDNAAMVAGLAYRLFKKGA